MDQLLTRVQANDPKLTSISLLNSRRGQYYIQKLALACKSNSHLLSLQINYPLDDEGIQAVIDILSINTTLTSLVLSFTQIPSTRMVRIAQAIRRHPSLQALGLRNNELKDIGTQHISTALSSSLVSLDLSWNQIATVGIQHLSMALSTNSTLLVLDLSHNGIGSDASVHLAKMLQTNSTLVSLDLNHNQINNDSCEHLAEALQANSSLTHLNLSDNQIGDRGMRFFAAALKSNSSLMTLDVSDNTFTDRGINFLIEAFEVQPEKMVVPALTSSFNYTLTTLTLQSTRIIDRLKLRLMELVSRNKDNYDQRHASLQSLLLKWV